MKVFGRKVASIVSFVGVAMVMFVGQASAHVVVGPEQALTGAFQTFTMSVPNEKDMPTTKLKLEIPDGLQYVTPNVKQGWTISTDKQGSGEEAKVKSITWTGGSITTGLRDEFTFSAKLPNKATELQWKAFQTYENGTVVSWDQPESADSHHSENKNSGPFSVTKVSDTAPEASQKSAAVNSDKANGAFTVGIIALVMSVLALGIAAGKSKK